MKADSGSIAILIGLDDGGLERLHNADVMGKVRASLAKAPDIAQKFATESLSDALKSALNVPLIDVLAAAWKTRQDLRKYCDQSKYPPGEVSNYVLAEHVVSSTHHPRFQVILDGTPCGPEIEFDVELKLTIEAASFEIINARVTKVATGTIQGSGTISCAGITVLEKETAIIDIPGNFSFGEGFLIGTPYRSDPASTGPTT